MQRTLNFQRVRETAGRIKAIEPGRFYSLGIMFREGHLTSIPPALYSARAEKLRKLGRSEEALLLSRKSLLNIAATQSNIGLAREACNLAAAALRSGTSNARTAFSATALLLEACDLLSCMLGRSSNSRETSVISLLGINASAVAFRRLDSAAPPPGSTDMHLAAAAYFIRFLSAWEGSQQAIIQGRNVAPGKLSTSRANIGLLERIASTMPHLTSEARNLASRLAPPEVRVEEIAYN